MNMEVKLIITIRILVGVEANTVDVGKFMFKNSNRERLCTHIIMLHLG